MTRTSTAATGALVVSHASIIRLLDTKGEIRSALDLILNILFVAVVPKYYFFT
jgi:hypothetical protein